MYSYLQDIEFLKKLDSFHVSKRYVRIFILDSYERVLKDLTGHVKDGGSVNADGASAVRRTSSLTLVVNISTEQEREEIEELLSINKKIKIEVGIENTLKDSFDRYADLDIIWFPMGIFYMTSPSFNHSADELSITLQLNDKMCNLNGTNGGIIPADIELDRVDDFLPEVNDDGELTGRLLETSASKKIALRQIIYELVNHMGGEQLAKVIVDIPEEVKVVKRTYENYINLYEITGENKIMYAESAVEASQTASRTFSPNQDIGFALEEFSYNNGKEGLTATANSSITDSLDKIKNFLTNYEYFYDTEGNFIFQEIKNYLNISKSTDVLEDLNKTGTVIDYLKHTDGISTDYSIDKYHSKSVYNFDNNNLIVSCSNNPQYEQIKNDFIVWGKKSEGEIPIRYHVVLDDIPRLTNKKYEYYFIESPLVDEIEEGINYTMGLRKAETIFPQEGLLGVFYYNPSNQTIYIYDGCDYITLEEKLGEKYNKDLYIVHTPSEAPYINASDWRTQFYLDGVVAENEGLQANDYYIELKNEWPKIIDVKKLFKNTSTAKELKDLMIDNLDASSIDYYLDFLSTADKINRFNVSSIGKRTMVISESESGANCLFENDIPGYCYILVNKKRKNTPASSFFSSTLINEYRDQINKILDLHYTPVLIAFDDYQSVINGGTLNSAYEVAKNAIYQYTGYNEKITLDTLPIYHLEPNTRITVNDTESGIKGDYIIDSINFPLDINSTMSLTCSRALDKL